MKAFMDIVEKWLKKAILIQLMFLVAAQTLLHFDQLVPYLNKAVASEGVIRFFKPAAKAVFSYFTELSGPGIW